MSGATDLRPNLPDSRQRGRFRTGTNRRLEITLQKELDDVGKKTVSDIKASREILHSKPLENPVKTMRKLAPEFQPNKPREKRKSEPVFHEDLEDKLVRSKSPKRAIFPTYNPLDREDSVLRLKEVEKSNTFPYKKENTITTEEMKKPHLTSLGFLPYPSGENNAELNVVMQGKGTLQNDDPIIGAIEMANSVPSMETVEEEELGILAPPSTRQFKPAIVGSIGTTAPASFVPRPPPASKPMTFLRPAPRINSAGSAQSDASSFKSVDIHLPDERLYQQYDDVIDQVDDTGDVKADAKSGMSSVHTVKSVKDLVEEAKQIASTPASQAQRSRQNSLISRNKPKVGNKAKAPSSKSRKSEPKCKAVKEKEVPQSKERTVDEIIMSLKDQSKTRVVSDADRKIQEIMDKVIARTKAVLGDIDTGLTKDNSVDSEPDTDSVSEMSGKCVDDDGDKTGAADDDDLNTVAETGDDFSHSQTTTITIDEPPTEESQSIALMEVIEEVERMRVEEDTESRMRDAEERAAEAERQMLQDEEEQRMIEANNLRKVWDDMNASLTVTYEDIVSLEGKTSQLHQKQPVVTSDPDPDSPLLSSWVPSGDDKTPATRKGIHHFCKLSEDVQLPDPYRGVWRRYHIPSKFDVLGPVGATERLQSAQVAQGKADPSDQQEVKVKKTDATREGITSQRLQSAAAKRILEEAQQMDGANGDSLHDWQRRAQQVFDQSELEVDGKKMELKTDESFVYWTPAPPKWSVAPSVVKQDLFPSYHGAALAEDGEMGGMDGMEEEEEDEEEMRAPSGEESEERFHKDRLLRRTCSSARDLTDLSRSNLDRQKTETEKPEEPAPRDIQGQFSIAAGEFDSALMDKETDKYKVLREQIENMLSSVLNAKLGSNFLNIADIGFRSGSVMVDFQLRVAYNAPIDVVDRICLLLQDAATEGTLAQMGVAPDSVDVQDESMAVLASARAASKTNTPKTMSTKQQSDMTAVRQQATEQEMPTGSNRPERPGSAPGKMSEEEDLLMIYQDYDSIVTEIKGQKQQLQDIKSGKKVASPVKATAAVEEYLTNNNMVVESEARPVSVPQTEFMKTLSAHKKEAEPTPAELALAAGRSYVLLPQKKGKKKRHHGDMSRIEEVEKFLAKPSSVIERSMSMLKVNTVFERDLRVPPRLKNKHRASLPDILHFDNYKTRKGYGEEQHVNEREWIRGIWNHWFDAVFPPTPEESEWSQDESDNESVLREEKPMTRRPSAVESVYTDSIVVEPVIMGEEGGEQIELLEDEVKRLTEEIDSSDHPRPYDLCRRGAILRKLGNMKPALEDLNAAIGEEPQMLDAYWHRHLVSLLQNKRQQALEDLNFILKHNKTHIGAFRSRAEIFRDNNDITMAIVNFSQAVKVDPDDYEAYYQRAQMYEQRGEMLLAMEDYAKVTKIHPAKTEALFKHGLHYFNNSNWQSSIDDFTELIKQDPKDAVARLYRGRANTHLKQWNSALHDFSATIHLDPNNAKAFYYRACILRKLHPKKALQDYSVSLLLDDKEDNIMAYLHRGILYNEICKPEDAVPDFEAVLKLDKDMACAHVNLGLIFMLKMESHHRAIKKFSNAIKADPTYVKAYICRAEAHQKVHDIKNALLDITRAIHLQPDMQHLYMYRGQLILKMGNLDLAAFCVKHASELNSGLGQSPTQQAIVQSFLKNYDKAIEALEAATRIKPVPPLFMLLGKTQMKARLWKEAVASFEKALDLVEVEMGIDQRSKKPWQEKQSWPAEAAEMYYLVGMCQTELRDYLNAHDAFNNAIRVNSKYAQAYYWRGQARMKLKQSKGIQDFNRALALDPELFQAYLSRAAYYGLRKQYTKAILNCNEAIRLQTNSLRGYLYRGALKYHIKAFSLAIRDLTQAIAIDSTCSLAYFNRAVCYHDSGNYHKALQDYGIVLLLGDMLVLKVLINRGLLYYDKQDYTNALHDFMMAADVYPMDKRIHHTLGLCYHKLGRVEEAVKSFTLALELDHSFLDALLSRGNVYMDFGTSIGRMYARYDYERALHYQPGCLPARVNLAYNLQVDGKFQQAWHQFNTAIDLDPRFKPALEGRAIINLQMSATYAAFLDINASISVGATAELLTNRGVIHQFMNDKVNAMRDYQHAIQLDASYSLAYFNAANIYFHTRHFKQALQYFSLALTHNKDDESALLNRAITKVMMKDSRGAVEDFNKAIKLSPYSAHMYFNRGNLFASMKLYEKAESDYSTALKLQPDDAMTHKRRADVRGKLGHREDAVADYRHAIEIQSRGKRL